MIVLYLSLLDEESDKNKFEKLYYRYKNLMYHISYEVVHDCSDAEDAVQEAFFRIAKNMDKIKDLKSSETKNFVAVVTKREAMKIYNKKKSRGENFDVDFSQIELPDGEDFINEVVVAIHRLPYKFSSLLTLKYVMGYSGKEISQITGLSETNVRQQMLVGRKKLQELLEEEVN